MYGVFAFCHGVIVIVVIVMEMCIRSGKEPSQECCVKCMKGSGRKGVSLRKRTVAAEVCVQCR